MKNKIIKHIHSELPFKKDGANLFLEIITTISVFLFTITLSGFFMVSSLVDSWDKGIVNGWTVQVKPDDTDEKTELRLNKVINFFENRSEIEYVKVVNDKQMHKLMAPWLGNSVDLSVLPIPKLIDVRTKKGSNVDFDKIAQELAETASYTTINSHQAWLKKLINFAQSVKILAFSVLLTVFTISSFSIFYATKTSLGIHQNVIEILHIMGATDDYVAKQYARRNFFVGLFSGIVGTVFGALGLWFVSSFATNLKGGIFDKATLDIYSIFCIILIPMMTAIISMITAYITVRKTLGKIV